MSEEKIERARQDEFKALAGEAAAEELRDGMIVGLGTGSTAKFAVDAIARRMTKGLRIIGIPTSEKTGEQARGLGIPLSTVAEHDRIDVTIDGADEVEAGTLNLIKGLGGALLREKIVASATNRLIIIVDESKLVPQLGTNDPIPVEVVPFEWQSTERRLQRMGGNPVLRKNAAGEVFITDGGHYILDCRFGKLARAAETEQQLNNTVGVVEHGLFLGMTGLVIVGGSGGIRTLQRG